MDAGAVGDRGVTLSGCKAEEIDIMSAAESAGRPLSRIIPVATTRTNLI
jgi:hypothetical protein